VGICHTEIVFKMNHQSLWSNRSWAHHILLPPHSRVPLLSIPSHSLLSPQVSLFEHPNSHVILCEPSQTHSHVSCSKYSSFVTSMIHCLSLPLWHQAADSSLGVGLLRPFPPSRARTEGGTFIDNHMRWSKQGLLWGIDSGDHGITNGHLLDLWLITSRVSRV